MGLHHFNVRPVATWLCLLAAGWITFGAARPATAQASHTSALPALNVTVAINKTRITVGEPVTLSIKMEVAPERPLVEVSASFQFPEGNGVELNVQPPGELDYQYAGALEVGSYPARPMRIVRTVPKNVEMLLLYDRTQPNGYLFSKPGRYTLSGEVRVHINNNPMPDVAQIPLTNIEVLPVEGRDAEVFALVDEPALARSLHLGVAPTTGILQTLEPVGEKYAKTPLGALALRSVGHQLALAESDQRERGAAMLQEYLANGLIPADPDYTAWAIAVAYHFSGKYDLAREWIFYSMRHYPDSVRIRAEDPLYKFYFYDPVEFASQVPWYLLEEPWVVPGAPPPTDLKTVQADK